MQLKNYLLALSFAIVSFVTFPSSAFADQIYKTHQGHTEVLFGWSHANVSRQHAEFKVAEGILNLADDIEKSSIDVTIQTDSLSTGYDLLDDSLKSKKYLAVDTYPEIKFVSTSVKKTGDKTFEVTGDLTLHGVTKSVVLDAEMTHRGSHPVAKWIEFYKGSLGSIQGDDQD